MTYSLGLLQGISSLFISTFPVHSPEYFFSEHLPSFFFFFFFTLLVLAVANAGSRVGP